MLGSPCRKKLGGKSVGGLRRLSTISEQEADKLDSNPTSHRSWGGSEWTGSSFSVCSDKFRNSSGRFSSDDSFQSDAGGNSPLFKDDASEVRIPQSVDGHLFVLLRHRQQMTALL